MASFIQCPLCNAPLVPVGKKGAKMRCDNCHSIFETSQVLQYYNLDAPDETGYTAHAYETAHMHEKELEKQRLQRNASRRASETPKTSPISKGSVFAETAEQMKTQFDSAYETTQNDYSLEPGNPTAAEKTRTGNMLIVWVLVFLFVFFPLASSCGSILFAFLEDDSFDDIFTVEQQTENASRRPSVKSESNATAKVNSNTNMTSASGALVQQMDISMKAKCTEDNYGEKVLLLEVTWTNPTDHDMTFAGDVSYKAYLDGEELMQSFGNRAFDEYDPDDAYNTVPAGKTSKTTLIFQLPDDVKGKLVVHFTAWDDYYDSGDNAPEVVKSIDLAL